MKVIYGKKSHEYTRTIFSPKLKMKILEALEKGESPTEVWKRMVEKYPYERMPSVSHLYQWRRDLSSHKERTKRLLPLDENSIFGEKKRLPEKISLVMLSFVIRQPRKVLSDRAKEEGWAYDANGSPRDRSSWLFIVPKLPTDIIQALKENFK